MRTFCKSCIQIERSALPHSSLRTRGTLEVDGTVQEHFRCLSCGARWMHLTDRWGTPCGFRLLPDVYYAGPDENTYFKAGAFTD